MSAGYIVNEPVPAWHPKLGVYPLLHGDILVQNDDGTFTKECPGICVHGFNLDPSVIEHLQPIEFERRGLEYRIL